MLSETTPIPGSGSGAGSNVPSEGKGLLLRHVQWLWKSLLQRGCGSVPSRCVRRTVVDCGLWYHTRHDYLGSRIQVGGGGRWDGVAAGLWRRRRQPDTEGNRSNSSSCVCGHEHAQGYEHTRCYATGYADTEGTSAHAGGRQHTHANCAPIRAGHIRRRHHHHSVLSTTSNDHRRGQELHCHHSDQSR